MNRQDSEIVEAITNLLNELSGDVTEVKNSMAGLRAWIAQEVARQVERAEAELELKMHDLSRATIHDAKHRARMAEKELDEIRQLMDANGEKKTVRLVHDAEGRCLGAIIAEQQKQ